MTPPTHPPALVPDPEVEARPQRRTFTAAYKARIVHECDQADKHGEINAILRREGLYSSHLSDWRRRLAQAGSNGLAPKKTGRPKKSPALRATHKELKRLRRELALANEKLRHAHLIIEAQKKLAQVLASLEAPLSAHSA